MGHKTGNFLAWAGLIGMIWGSTPAFADDNTKTGLIAALGLSAATGKVTLGDSSGAIEAEIFGTEGFQQAGAIIASIVNQRGKGKHVLVLGRSDTIDLISSLTIKQQVERADNDVKAFCAKPPEPVIKVTVTKTTSTPQGKKQTRTKSGTITGQSKIDKFLSGDQVLFDQGGAASTGQPAAAATTTTTTTTSKTPFVPSPTAADLGSAAAVDTQINGITITSDDRMLINAVLMNTSYPGWTGSPDYTGWTAWRGKEKATQSQPPMATYYWAPSEEVGIPPDAIGDLYARYSGLIADTNAMRANCPLDRGKAAIDTADTLIKALSTAGDKGPAPITAALQSEWFREKGPLVLRLAVEQSGGTAMARSGILYSLGWPNAGTVSAGLVVSFRLIDPRGGAILTLGIVRCVSRQSNIKQVADYLEHNQHRQSAEHRHPLGDTVCDFRIA